MKLLRGVLTVCILVLTGCQLATASPTVLPTGTATATTAPPPTVSVTPTAMIMCTPPPCWADEAYHCPGECPGGCGTVCATHTPDPAASPTPTIPPFAEICSLATPMPGAASMAVCADRENPRAGELVQIGVELSEIERSDFVLVSGQNTDDYGTFTARARTGGRSATIANTGAHLVLERVQSDERRLYLTLRAQSAGEIVVSFQVIPTEPDVHASIVIRVEP